MNQAHIHLLVNHVSFFGVLFGVAALMWSVLRRSQDMRLGSVVLFLLSGVFAWIATETGEGAEELVEHLPGVVESLIERHDEAAEMANVAVIVLAVGALVMEIIARWKSVFRDRWLKGIQILVLIVAIISCGLLARTAQIGGQIRHTEIREDAISNDH